MSVKIKGIDTIAEEDVYRRGGDYTTYTQLWINPDKRECGVGQESGAPGKGTPSEEWHNLVLTYDIGGGREFGRGEPEPAPDGDALEEFLESDEGQGLLDRICDGHDTVWDGNNMVGELDEDAEEAKDALLSAIADLSAEATVTWTVGDYFGQVSDSDIGLEEEMSSAQIQEIADEYEKGAREQDIYISGDVYEYLLERQKSMR